MVTEMDTIEDFRNLLRQNRFTCGDEYNREPLGTWLDVHPGERSDGLLYDNGKRYWASVMCLVCGYEWSFPKLFAYAARGQLDLQQLHKGVSYKANKRLMIKSADKPWKGVCSHGCWFARKRPCKCKCHRVNHQRGLQSFIDEYNACFEKNKDFFISQKPQGLSDEK